MLNKQQLYLVRKAYRKLLSTVLQKVYRDNVRDLTKNILVVGSARSGTTWLADLIASQFKSRIMFEPFNPNLVKEYRSFNYFQYMRPDEKNDDLYDFSCKLFSGNIRSAWIDREIQHLYPQGRVIKCIRSSLMLKWLDVNFPQFPKIFILRHPCAVVQSRISLGWATDDDLRHFLNQPKLMADFLNEKVEIIHNAQTIEEKHAVIWCITNLVPLKQFGSNTLNCVRYENLVQNPEFEIPRLFDMIGIPYSGSIYKKLSQPSLTSTNTSPVITGEKMTGKWKKTLSPVQIDNIINIVERFGLSGIYET
jgi:hypothetical protein